MLFTPKLFLGESKPVAFIVAIEFDKLASLTYMEIRLDFRLSLMAIFLWANAYKKLDKHQYTI